jgi:hypothetical protein
MPLRGASARPRLQPACPDLPATGHLNSEANLTTHHQGTRRPGHQAGRFTLPEAETSHQPRR